MRVLVGLVVFIAMLGAACSSDESAESSGELSVVVEWNDFALELIDSDVPLPPAPTVVSRQLFLLHAAMFDAWAAFDPTADVQYADPSLDKSDEELFDGGLEIDQVVNGSAAWMLFRLFPEDEEAIRSFVVSRNSPTLASPGVGTPEELGALIAEQIFRAKLDDGSYAHARYLAPSDPYLSVDEDDRDEFDWAPLVVPTGALTDEQGVPIVDLSDTETFVGQVFPTPHWGVVDAFALLSPDQFRPAARPSDEESSLELREGGSVSIAFTSGLTEVVAAGASLSEPDRDASMFWTDRSNSVSDVGAMNEVLREVSRRDRHDTEQDVAFYYAANAAMYDAVISAWDAKRVFNSARPITLVAELGRDAELEGFDPATGDLVAMTGATWHPLQDPQSPAPGWPSFPSVRAAVVEAGVEVIRQYSGGLEAGITMSGTNWWTGEAITVEWASFADMADSATNSVVDGGIGLRESADVGASMGRQIGSQAYVEASSHWLG